MQVAAQFASTAIISPPVDPNDENAQRTKNILAFLPLMIGYFALQVPSGLSLYYFSNTVLTSGQQIWLRKLGGELPFAFRCSWCPQRSQYLSLLCHSCNTAVSYELDCHSCNSSVDKTESYAVCCTCWKTLIALLHLPSYSPSRVDESATAQVADICSGLITGHMLLVHTLHVFRVTDIGPSCSRRCCCTAGASALADLGPIDIGKARRTGQSVSTTEDSNGFPRPEFAPGMTQASSSNGATAATATNMKASSGDGPSTSSAAEGEADEVSMMMLLTALLGIWFMRLGCLVSAHVACQCQST